MKLVFLAITITFAALAVAQAQPVNGFSLSAKSYCGAASEGKLLYVPERAGDQSVAQAEARGGEIVNFFRDAGWKGHVLVVIGDEDAQSIAHTVETRHPDLVVVAPPDVTMAWARTVVGPCA